MKTKELADFIVRHKMGSTPYPYGDDFIVAHHVRSVLFEHRHITTEHILECCEKAVDYDAFIELCRPLAKSDTESFLRLRNRPVARGRTRRK